MNPDDLLAQIMDLCEQYIGAGGDPAQVVDAVTQAAGGGGYGDQGGMPPGGGEMPPMPDQAPMMSGDSPVPDMTGGMPLDQQQPGNFTDFGEASSALAEEMKKRMTKAR